MHLEEDPIEIGDDDFIDDGKVKGEKRGKKKKHNYVHVEDSEEEVYEGDENIDNNNQRTLLDFTLKHATKV